MGKLFGVDDRAVIISTDSWTSSIDGKRTTAPRPKWIKDSGINEVKIRSCSERTQWISNRGNSNHAALADEAILYNAAGVE